MRISKTVQATRRHVVEAVVGAVTVAAINGLPPLAVEMLGHTMVGLGQGMQRAGKAVENAGEKTLEYADDQRERNDWVMRPGERGPTSISVGGVRYFRAES